MRLRLREGRHSTFHSVVLRSLVEGAICLVTIYPQPGEIGSAICRSSVFRRTCSVGGIRRTQDASSDCRVLACQTRGLRNVQVPRRNRIGNAALSVTEFAQFFLASGRSGFAVFLLWQARSGARFRFLRRAFRLRGRLGIRRAMDRA